MAYTPATYDEYCKASKYAKIRYRFGVYIQLISAILLLFLIYYTVSNIEEMKANPKDYAEEKIGVICYPKITIYDREIYYGNDRDTTNTKEW